MARFFFHSQDGQRCIDRTGTEMATDDAARVEMIRRAGLWIAANPATLLENHECRMEITLADFKPIFSIMMFTVDPRSFGKR